MAESTILHINVEIANCCSDRKASQIILEYLTKASKSSLDYSVAHAIGGDLLSTSKSSSVLSSSSHTSSWRFENISIPFLFSCGAVYKKSSTDLLPVRVFYDFDIQPDDYIRVHYTPRLYPIAQMPASFWRERVVFECENFLVINKPAGIPSNPTVDNFYENILQVYNNVYGKKEEDAVDSEPPLFLPQRLDTDTSGLLLMARTKIFAGYFGQLLKDRATKSLAKRYRALVASEDGEDAADGPLLLAPGTLKGHLSRQQVTPRVFVRTPPQNTLGEDTKTDTTADWQYCETRIVGSSSRIAKSVAEWMEWIDGQRGEDDPGDKAQEEHVQQLRAAFCEWFVRYEGSRRGLRIALQEVELELVTGRTHQIRGQLQALQRGSSSSAPSAGAEAEADDYFSVLLAGGHIAGDNLYTGCTSNSLEPVKMSPHLALQVRVNVLLLVLYAVAVP